MKLAEVLVIVFVVTLPFGFWRAYTRKFSVRWFLAIHLPVPLVFLARFEAHLSYVYIPCTCAAFFAGQFLGSYLGRRWVGRRVRARAGGYPPAG
jgi:hypothetical protein